MGFRIQTTSYIINIRRDCSTIDSRDVTTANIPDNKMYVPLTSSSFVFPLSSLRYMVADPGYDAKELYEYSKGLGIVLVCPLLKDMKVLPKRDLSLYVFINRHWYRPSTAREGYPSNH
jgi:hypothetical protein